MAEARFCLPDPGEDLTGTVLRASAPVAVFVGHDCALVPFDRFACDHLEEALPPVTSLGRQYAVARVPPVLPRSMGDPPEGEPTVVRILATRDATELSFSPTAVHSTARLDAGSRLEFEFRDDFVLSASAPVLVATLRVGADWFPSNLAADRRSLGDPSLAFETPVEQYRRSYDFLVPGDFPRNHATVVSPRGTRLRIDGGPLRDFEFNSVVDPAVAFDRAGVLHSVWLGISFDRPSPGIRTAESRDRGASWSMARSVEPAGRCAGGCDSPSLGMVDGDALMVAYIARSTRGEAWVIAQRGTGSPSSFGPAITLGGVERAGDNHLVPTVVSVGVGTAGRVAVGWVLTRRENSRSALGDVYNSLRVALSSDGGRSFSPSVRVSRDAEPVVAHTPALAWTGADLHALYVTGEGDARWDLALATSRDAGARWTHRRVASDPPRCATHGWVALAEDPIRMAIRALWIDNRSGDGAVWTARCPADPAGACGADERVSGTRFAVHTGVDPTRWHGTRSALVRGPDGALHAAWSDTRSGGPAIYVARGRP